MSFLSLLRQIVSEGRETDTGIRYQPNQPVKLRDRAHPLHQPVKAKDNSSQRRYLAKIGRGAQAGEMVIPKNFCEK